MNNVPALTRPLNRTDRPFLIKVLNISVESETVSDSFNKVMLKIKEGNVLFGLNVLKLFLKDKN